MDRSGRIRFRRVSIIVVDVCSGSKDGLRDATDCLSYGERTPIARISESAFRLWAGVSNTIPVGS